MYKYLPLLQLLPILYVCVCGVYGECQCAAVKKMVENVYSLRLSATPAPFFFPARLHRKMAVAAAKTRSPRIRR